MPLRCAKEGDCQRAESGTIEFEKYNEKSASHRAYVSAFQKR